MFLMCSDVWMNLDRAKQWLFCHVAWFEPFHFLIYVEHDNGQTGQCTENYLGFCPTKKADFSYTYILALIIDYIL